MKPTPANAAGAANAARAAGPHRRSIWTELKPLLAHLWPVVGGLGALIVAAMLLDLTPPLIVRAVVDGHLAVGDFAGVWPLAALYLATLIATQAVNFGQNYLTALVGQNVLLRLRLSVAAHLEALPLAYFDRTPVGEIISRCTADVDAVNTLFTSGVIAVLVDVFRAAGLLVTMFALSPGLSGVALLVIPFVLALTEFFRRQIRRNERDVRRQVGVLNTHLQETYAGLRVVKAFGREGAFIDRFNTGLRGFVRAANRSSTFNSFFPPAMDILRASSIALLLWFGANPGTFLRLGVSVGTLVAFVQLLQRLFNPLTNLSDEYQTIQQAMAGVERITEVLNVAPEDRPAPIGLEPTAEPDGRADTARARAGHTTAGRVTVDALTFGYIPGRPVLSGLSLDIRPGERLVIAGRTGAGKTSLLHLMAGLYAPWAGGITIDGVDPRRIPADRRRRLIGVVAQAVQLFEGTVAENVALGDLAIPPERVRRALELVGAWGFVAALPKGVDTFLGPGGSRLSFGQTQLIALARAIVSDPPVLLLDEPTSGMDSDTERLIYRALKESSRERTVITVAHRLSSVIEAERVVILSGGRIVQSGTPEELSRNVGWFGVYRDLESLGWSVEGGGRGGTG
ncbi:MAG: ABC transporter ATP-binding protein, partial [Bacillota bacterium]